MIAKLQKTLKMLPKISFTKRSRNTINEMINPNYYTKGIPLTEFILSHDIGFAEGCETINQLKKDHKKPSQILINRYNKIIKDVPKERLNHIKKKIKFQGLGFFV